MPATPGELVAMQRPGPEAPVAQALALQRRQDLTPWESQQVALALLAQLEAYHHGVIAEMQDNPETSPAQVACWAIDGDRLMHCRRLLESITLI